MTEDASTAEDQRLLADASRVQNWKRWGPYLAERQWGTVREDYSADGTAWEYFPHEQARSRAYRWGEDGLLGISDRQCRLCFAITLWNGRDAILKERLFGLTGPQGNHGEDVKEYYFYLDSTPTHSYMKALYKYPQEPFPYERLLTENRQRDRQAPEFELYDSGIFAAHRYFDVFAEYAKASPNDVLIRLTVANHGPEPASLHLLPTLWFRNTWSWHRTGDGYWPKPSIARLSDTTVVAQHTTLGRFHFAAEPLAERGPSLLFTENETNAARLFGAQNATPYVKDAFHDYLIHGRTEAINPAGTGTKVAAHYCLDLPPGETMRLRFRLCEEVDMPQYPFSAAFDHLFVQRLAETEAYFAARLPAELSAAEQQVMRQAYAGLLWTKQFYHYIVKDWLEGDPAYPAPPASRHYGRNHDWTHLFNRDIIAVPDKWEYPWYAAWDLAFHMLPFADVDANFAKEQLVLFLREWYMHPNGQIPAYEFAFSDVNPPVHAWACWRVYKLTGRRSERDQAFLARVFQKLLINFTWWVNRKDITGKHIFAGGFLGLDNIGVFDRSQPLPTGGHLEQADGTAWMAFYCVTMLSMALELAQNDPVYEDVASKFFEHFVAIADAMNTLGGSGLWDDTDGFYYDWLHSDGSSIPLRVRSMVGLIPLMAVEVLDGEVLERLPGFAKRLQWFLDNRQDLARHISYMEPEQWTSHPRRLLAIPSRQRLERVLRYLLDEQEFLAPYGIRSLSRLYQAHPYVCHVGTEAYHVEYLPAESNVDVFGGNSNWRGPIWFPVNYLLIEALERYHYFYGDSLQVECPTGSGQFMHLGAVARELTQRLVRLFLPGEDGRRPCHGQQWHFATDPHWRELLLYHEYFHAETGQGLGASHQTGWTALVTRCLADLGRHRAAF
jgi:mannosylglycerate hydrolase MGH1-like protein